VREIGRVDTDTRPSGRIRYRVVIEVGGVTYRIARKEIAPGLNVSFSSLDAAREVLDGIRHLLAKGYSVPRAISQFLPTFNPEDLIENRLVEHLGHLRELVAQGKRSPSTLREVERYAQPEGHFSFWYETNAREITFGQVEDWHKWLGRRGIAVKTQKNISDTFRAFLRRIKRRGEIESVPEFPAFEVPEYAPTIITLEQQAKILDAIPWERRGLFLCAATEALRVGELRALELDDYSDGRLRVTKTIQGKGRNERVVHFTKNRSVSVREIWSPALLDWIDWRLGESTPEQRLRGEVMLFPNPTALNPAKRWGHQPAEEEWRKACEQARVSVSLQEGTRHCILTRLAGELPERMLQAFSRHRDAKSLSHYTKPRATKAAIERIAGVHTKAGNPPPFLP
jgi:integrase